jgi:hypothetical protein
VSLFKKAVVGAFAGGLMGAGYDWLQSCATCTQSSSHSPITPILFLGVIGAIFAVSGK